MRKITTESCDLKQKLGFETLTKLRYSQKQMRIHRYTEWDGTQEVLFPRRTISSSIFPIICSKKKACGARCAT